MASLGGPARAAERDILAARDGDASRLLAEAAAAIELPEVVTLEAVVNDQPSGTVFVRVGRLGIEIEEAALKRWRIVVPAAEVRPLDGRNFVPLTALPGASAHIVGQTQRLVVTVPPNLFEPSAIPLGQPGGPAFAPPPWSAFANYDIFGYAEQGGTRYGSGLFEIGTSGPYGSGVATGVANSSQYAGGTTGRFVFLDANWRYDNPSGPWTLVGGTAVSPAGAWGRALRFGGVQFGTNFTLQPDLITYPLPAFPGTAAVPSTVDVLVNGAKVGAEQVPPGPFTISNVPVVTGSGDVQFVVRDAFGQQQVVTQPFYTSRRLLRPGLDDWSVNAGAERLGYGIDSFDFGSGFVSAYWRRGLSDRVTVELLGEGDGDARAAGATIDFLPGQYGVFTLGAAGSNGGSGSGSLVLAGYEYQGRRFNAGARSVWASPSFRRPGDPPGAPLMRLSLASAGYNFGPWGTVGVAWVDQQNRGEAATATTAVTYSTSLSTRTSFVVSLARTRGTTSQTSAYATLIYALDARTSLSGDVSSARGGGTTHTVGGATLQRTLPVGEGYGYRLRAAGDDQYQAGAVYAGPYGRYGVDVARASGVTAARGEIAGGIGAADGVVFAARPIVDSFGIVRVDQVPGVAIYQNGNFAGRTDDHGIAVLTQLFPYARNRITINDKDVPIDITLNAREQQVAPYYRSAVVVDFGARRAVNAIVEVRLSDGRPLPAGAEVRREGGATTYPVGSEGEIFVTDLDGGKFVADWAGGRCRFSIDAAAIPREPLPRVGPVACVSAKE
jgi:outer membrane usher protein